MALHTCTTDAQVTALLGTPGSPGTAKDGDVIYLAPNTLADHYTAPAGGWLIEKTLEIYSDGPGFPWAGGFDTDAKVQITPNSVSDPVFVILPNTTNGLFLPDVYIHDLGIRNTTKPSQFYPGADAIQCIIPNPGSNDLTVEGLKLQRLTIQNMGGDGIHLEGYNAGPGAIDHCMIQDCRVTSCQGHGLYLFWGAATYVLGCQFNYNFGYDRYYDFDTAGVTIISSDVRVYSCEFVNNLDPSYPQGTYVPSKQSSHTVVPIPNYNTQLRLKSCSSIGVIGGHFEDFSILNGTTPVFTTALGVEDGGGGIISGCAFGLGNGQHTGTRGVFLISYTRGVMVAGNKFDWVDKIVEVATSDNCLGNVVQANMVGSGNTTDARSLVVLPDVDDNGNIAALPTTPTSNVDAGMLLPRVTTSTRDGMVSAYSGTTIPRGLVLYNSSTSRLNVWDGTNWLEVPVTGGPQVATVVAKTADQSISVTTATDVSDLTVALAASDVIHFHAYLIASADATSTGIQLAINGPTSPSAIAATIEGWTSTTAQATPLGVEAYDTFQANTTSAGTAKRVFEIYGRVINGSNAGTFALRAKSEVNAHAITIHRGSWLSYWKGTN